MGLFDRFKKKKETKPKVTKQELNQQQNKQKSNLAFSPTDKAFANFVNKEIEKRNNMTPNELKEYKKELNRKFKMMDKQLKEQEEYTKLLRKYADNNVNGEKLEKQGNIEGAIKLYEENVRLKADTPHTYEALANIYHNKKEFENEKRVLVIGIENCGKIPNTRHLDTMKKSLKCVEHYLNTGKWEYNCLSYQEIQEKIKIAKNEIKTGDKEKGIEILEKLVKSGSTTYTVYYTLYQTYLKNKQYDEAIRISNNAIEVLGANNEDNIRKWENYLQKAIKQKENN